MQRLVYHHILTSELGRSQPMKCVLLSVIALDNCSMDKLEVW